MKNGKLTAKCLGIITDKQDRECLQKATANDIPSIVVDRKTDEPPEEYDMRLTAAIRTLQARSQASGTPVIALMGWLHILSPVFLMQFRSHVINVHPSLLPKYGGKGMYGNHVHKAVLQAKETESGISLHMVEQEVDTGKVLIQKTCPVYPDDSADTLRLRVQGLEKEWYPRLLEMMERGEVRL